MGFRDANLIEKEYFHIYNRGNGKIQIFYDDEDYNRFMKLLYICNSEKSFKFRDTIVNQKIDAWDFDRGEPLVDICAWVLMPNHFHILLESHRSDLWRVGYNPITEFIRKVSTAYAMYFNKKYKRTGALFEGKFKSKYVGRDDYFNYLFAYIHFNPLKLIQSDWKEKGILDRSKALSFLQGFYFSSFQDLFAGNRKESRILNTGSLPENIKTDHVYELFKWIQNSPQVRPVGNF